MKDIGVKTGGTCEQFSLGVPGRSFYTANIKEKETFSVLKKESNDQSKEAYANTGA